MTFDQQIKKTLEKNSEWPGSSDQLWERISTQLEQKKRPWHKQPFWLGTAVAAILLLALMVQSIRSPLPPETPTPEMLSRMQSFSTIMLSVEPRSVNVGEQLELPLDIYLTEESEPEHAQLLIWKTSDTEDLLVSELLLDGSELFVQGSLDVDAPTEPGTYRLVVQGLTHQEGQAYAIYAEETIRVEGKNDHEQTPNN